MFLIWISVLAAKFDSGFSWLGTRNEIRVPTSSSLFLCVGVLVWPAEWSAVMPLTGFSPRGMCEICPVLEPWLETPFTSNKWRLMMWWAVPLTWRWPLHPRDDGAPVNDGVTEREHPETDLSSGRDRNLPIRMKSVKSVSFRWIHWTGYWQRKKVAKNGSSEKVRRRRVMRCTVFVPYISFCCSHLDSRREA